MTAKRWISGLVGIGMLAFFAAGCDDGEGDALTPEEAAALAQVIGRASVGPLLDQSLGSLPPDDRAHMAAKEYDFDKPCSEGGSVNLSGTADFGLGEDEKSVEIEGTITFDHCAEKTDDDVTFTLDGSIDMRLHALFSLSGRYPSHQGGWQLDWKRRMGKRGRREQRCLRSGCDTRCHDRDRQGGREL